MDNRRVVLILYQKGNDEKTAQMLEQSINTRDGLNITAVAVSDDSFSTFFTSQISTALYRINNKNALFLNKLYYKLNFKPSKRKINTYNLDKNIERLDLRDNISKKENNVLNDSRIIEKYEKIKNLLLRFDPEIVICLSSKLQKMILSARDKYKFYDMKVFCYIADYAVNLQYIDPRSDGYIVSNESSKKEILKYRIACPYLKVAKLADDVVIYSNEDRDEIFKILNIKNKDIANIFISCASMAKAYVKGLIESIVKSGINSNIFIDCRENYSLLDIAKYSSSRERVYIYNITNNEQLYKLYSILDIAAISADTILTWELILSEIPMIMLKAMSESESINSEYLLNNELAVDGSSNKKLISAIEKILSDAYYRNKIKKNQRMEANVKNFDDVISDLDNISSSITLSRLSTDIEMAKRVLERKKHLEKLETERIEKEKEEIDKKIAEEELERKKQEIDREHYELKRIRSEEERQRNIRLQQQELRAKAEAEKIRELENKILQMEAEAEKRKVLSGKELRKIHRDEIKESKKIRRGK